MTETVRRYSTSTTPSSESKLRLIRFEVQSEGDGFMLAFSSARRALDGALAIQQSLAAYNSENPVEPIRVRSGLHTGEAVVGLFESVDRRLDGASRMGGAR